MGVRVQSVSFVCGISCVGSEGQCVCFVCGIKSVVNEGSECVLYRNYKLCGE